MLNFTKQEKFVLWAVACVFLIGTAVDYVLKKYPRLNDFVYFADSEGIYPKININKANQEELMNLPYIGEQTAAQILEYRRAKGNFKSIDELKNIPGIQLKNFPKMSRLLTL